MKGYENQAVKTHFLFVGKGEMLLFQPQTSPVFPGERRAPALIVLGYGFWVETLRVATHLPPCRRLWSRLQSLLV